jgi:hypothetical protein
VEEIGANVLHFFSSKLLLTQFCYVLVVNSFSTICQWYYVEEIEVEALSFELKTEAIAYAYTFDLDLFNKFSSLYGTTSILVIHLFPVNLTVVLGMKQKVLYPVQKKEPISCMCHVVQ